MEERFSRTEMLLGNEAFRKIRQSRIAVFGVGGVGGYVVEALVRCGVGTLDLIDRDTVSESNLNRQIIALTSNIGQPKVSVAARRAREINPDVHINEYHTFFMPDHAGDFDFSQYDYVVDAVDTVSAKIALVLQAQQAGVPVISSMGAGNKLDPTQFEIADIYQTSVCPLARVMRKELKARGVKKLTVVYSREMPRKPQQPSFDPDTGKPVPASISFVPSAVGLIVASKVIRDIAGIS